jgi:hypothetical protein
VCLPSEDYAHDNYEDLKDFIVDEEPAAPARAADRAPVTLSMSRMLQPFNHMALGQAYNMSSRLALALLM